MMQRLFLCTLLLLTERLHFAYGKGGCGFCQDGSLSNPETLIALTSPYQVHSCSEWQQTSSLTENFSDVACKFIGPFYEAICGCSSLSTRYDQCDLCGSPDMVLSNPSRGLLIPKSNSEQILCTTVYRGVQMRAVPSNDCQILRGITDYCGGCEPRAERTTGAGDFLNPLPTLPPSMEAFVSNIETPEPSSAKDSSTTSFPPSMVPISVSSAESSSRTTTKEPSSVPIAISSALPSSSEPSIATTGIPTSIIADRSAIEEFVSLSEFPATCDLCPSNGILSTPDKVITIVNINNKTVTKTCGTLLWDVRAGQDDIDGAACSFLHPFFGSICGCSTFTPLVNETVQTDTQNTTNIEINRCKMCENSTHVFQRPFNSLHIPGSNTTQITCGALFSGAKSGAVTTDECEILSSLAYTCGGCGLPQSSFYNEPPPPKQCVDCSDENESSIYIYKDFGASGTSFHKALSAPLHCDSRGGKYESRHGTHHRNRHNGDCSRLLYPELQGCVLAPITSFDELVRIQSVIPPEKAAYTAVHKDGLALKKDAEVCYSSMKSDIPEKISFTIASNGVSGRISSENCRVENWMEDLKFGYSHHDYESVTESTRTNNTGSEALDACELLKLGWSNYNTGTDVPHSLWKNGQPSYCNVGPAQEVGAIWAVEPDGQNYGDLRDVSTNWLLPGAVYKCCKKIYSCFEHTNSK